MTAHSSTRRFSPSADATKKGNAVCNFWRTLLIRTFVAAIAAFALAGETAQAAKLKVLHSFCALGQHHSCNDGSNPQGALVVDAAGNLFGTSFAGGHDFGAAFELERKPGSKFTFKTIFRFCTFCGQNPSGPLIIDTQGNLYGTAKNLVFELSPVVAEKRWTETILYQFCAQQNCTDGNGPLGGLTYAGASSGALYDGVSPLHGVTAGGGANNEGTVFELANSNGHWTETVLYSFCSQGGDKCTDGKLPISGLLADASGNLFGTTLEGGTQQAGIAFEMSPNENAWDYTILYTFCSLADCTDGAGPSGPLTLDTQGNLLGTTGAGGTSCQRGASGCGTIVKIMPNGSQSQESVLHSFCQQRDCRDGAGPEGGVVLDASGALCGTTTVGGGNDIDQHGAGGGTVFKLEGGSLNVLHKFCALANCADGELPRAGITLDQTGAVYGTTEYGGAYGNDTVGGTVFRVMP